MDTSDFEIAVSAAWERDPILFALPGEGPMSRQGIEQAEASLRVSLPQGAKWFFRHFGAGHFALVVIYSLVSSGQDSVAAALELPWVDSTNFLPIADNGVGDYWGFTIDTAGRASTEVYVLDHEHGLVRNTPSYDNFLEFVATVGLAHQ